jgi:transcription antitermination factor NusG
MVTEHAKPDIRWHVVHVFSGKETKVAAELKKHGLEAYVPLRETKRRVHAHMHRVVMVPIFVGYVFCGFDPVEPKWGQINYIDGVIRLLLAGGTPVSIPDIAMDRIREIEARGGDIAKHNPMRVRVGQAVRIIDYGSWTGLFAPVVAIDAEKRRVQVEFDILGGKVPTWFDEKYVEAL